MSYERIAPELGPASSRAGELESYIAPANPLALSTLAYEPVSLVFWQLCFRITHHVSESSQAAPACGFVAAGSGWQQNVRSQQTQGLFPTLEEGS
jgi:hypothetical protein